MVHIPRPGYLRLNDTGELSERVEHLKEYYRQCFLCPHECGVDRTKGDLGVCRSGIQAVVASANAHHGEEPPISGTQGSGTVFLSGCTGKCLFCQNYPISQLGTGKTVDDSALADMMLKLQHRGCHNINFVTPTHFAPSLISAVKIASDRGLSIPIVYNTSGYERVEILKLLDGIVDVYLPDMKYADDTVARELSGFKNYSSNNRAAIKEMYRQVGRLKVRNGLAYKGLIVRHLVLPSNLSGTDSILGFLATELSQKIHISLMSQYFPAHTALNRNDIGRRITEEEYDRAISYLTEMNLDNGWFQEYNSV